MPPSRQRTRTKDIPADRVGKVGNTTLLTATNADRLIQTVVSGVPLDVAAAYCGIHRDTVRKWRRRGEKALELSAGRRSPTERRYADFVQRLDTAMAETSVLAQATLKRLIMGSSPMIIRDASGRDTGERIPVPMTDTEKRIQADMIKFYLSRRERKHYGVTVQAEISGPNGGPILSADMSGQEAWVAFTEMFGEPNDVDYE